MSDKTADIIILPTVRVERRDARPDPVAKVQIGKFSFISIYAFTAEEMCVPLVELHGATGEIDNLTVEQAETIGAALIAGAAKARGERT